MTNKQLQEDFQKVRRFIIVQMNKSGVDSINRMRALQKIDAYLTDEEMHACAEAIRSGEYQAFDLVHDIMGLVNQDIGFVPRINPIAEASV